MFHSNVNILNTSKFYAFFFFTIIKKKGREKSGFTIRKRQFDKALLSKLPKINELFKLDIRNNSSSLTQFKNTGRNIFLLPCFFKFCYFKYFL